MPGFTAYGATIRGGEQLYGFIEIEAANSVTFRTLDGSQRTVLRGDLVELASQKVSLLPEGLESSITQQEMADLLAFLRQSPSAD